MCQGCWEERGQPKIDNEKVRAVQPLLAALYAVHSAGGMAHVVADDWNIDDDLVRASLEDLDPGDRESSAALAVPVLSAMLDMTIEERASALALHRGYWKP